MWLARGLNGLLGATKRRMLSFAEAPPCWLSPFVGGIEVDTNGVPLVMGAAEGMMPVGNGGTRGDGMLQRHTKVTG